VFASEGNVGKPTLKQVLDAHKNQVLVGKSYLNIASGLLQADPVILQTAPTFFGLTIDGSLELAQMALARLYDKTKGAMTVQAMLAQAREQVGSFKRGDHQQIVEVIARSEGIVLSLQPVLTAIRKRRNEWLAHLDPRTIADPQALVAKAKLTLPDIERVFKESEEILLPLSSLYEGTIGDLRFVGGDDYKHALDLIRRARCAYIENYEREFGSWTGPRPEHFSSNPFGMI
jgi:hypothetical protein